MIDYAMCANAVLSRKRHRANQRRALNMSDFKAELEQLAMNARRTPKRILDTHPPDQRASQSRFVADLHGSATSNARNGESRPDANGRGSRDG